GESIVTNTVTPNDAGDTDTGPNNLQNFPVIASAVVGGTHVTGTLDTTASGAFNIELFLNSACDGSGNGEGESFVASQAAVESPGGSGHYVFDFTVPTITTGQVFTAT